MNKSESIIELAKALSKFQGEVKQPKKDKTNPHFKSNFVSLDGVVAAITETASKYGLSFVQFPINNGEQVGVYTVIMHDSGEWIQSEPVFTNLQKKDPQGVGAALTYMRRYSLSAVFGITSEIDDDAEGAMDRSGGYQKTPPQQYNQSPPPQYNQAPPQQGTNLISEAQVKMIKALIGNVVKATGTDASMVVDLIKTNLKIAPEVRTNELTKGQASAFIKELQEMEKGR